MDTFDNSGLKDRKDGSDISKELRECKLNKALAQKRKQQLHANSHELRHLERQLQSAIVYKQLSEQQQYIAQRKENELRKKREDNAKLEAECEVIRNSMLQQEEQEKMKKMHLLASLKSQISDKQQKRLIEFENIKKDSIETDKLLKQIQSEKFAEQRESKLLREVCKKEMDEFYRNKELQKQFEKDKSIEDNQRNIAYQKECDFLKSKMLEERKRAQEEKEVIIEQLAKQLAVVNQEKEKREDLLSSLLLEERRAKDEQSYREALVKQIKKRDKIRNDMEKFLHESQNRKERQFREEEDKFLEKHLHCLEERDKINQLSDEKRRRKKIEHSKALREMIEVRRVQKANEIAARVADFEEMLNAQKASNHLIEEERKQILNAVPKELLRYLPKGVLKSSDIEFLTMS